MLPGIPDIRQQFPDRDVRKSPGRAKDGASRAVASQKPNNLAGCPGTTCSPERNRRPLSAPPWRTPPSHNFHPYFGGKLF